MSHIIDRRVDSRGKSSPNRERFLKRIKDNIKKAIPDVVGKQSIKDSGKKGVRIPVKGIKEPYFRHDPKLGKRYRTLPGNDQFKPGDTIDKPPCGGGKGKRGSDSGGGNDDFVYISGEEFDRYFLEDLELPYLVKKQLQSSTEEFTLRFAGQTKTGVPPRLNVVKTYKNAMGRDIGSKAYLAELIAELEEELENEDDEEKRQEILDQIEEIKDRKVPFIDDIDLRYNHYVKEPVPISSAVMFCLMDVSASMQETEKDIAKRFFRLLYRLLNLHYDTVDIVFIRHHHEAQEVDEDTFFYDTETGGTVVSTGLKLINKIIDERYPLHQWNVYISQATDGDSFEQDGECSGFLLNTLMKKLQYFAYIQINSWGEKNLWADYLKVAGEYKNFEMRHIKRVNEIYEVFRGLFRKREKKERS